MCDRSLPEHRGSKRDDGRIQLVVPRYEETGLFDCAAGFCSGSARLLTANGAR